MKMPGERFFGTAGGVGRCMGDRNRNSLMEVHMLYWALLFLVVALIAGVFGFGGIASASAGIAQILFFIFLVLFVVALIARAVGGRAP